MEVSGPFLRAPAERVSFSRLRLGPGPCNYEEMLKRFLHIPGVNSGALCTTCFATLRASSLGRPPMT